MQIRTLKANEIECRVGSVNKTNTGMSLLLYKDARADMKILDEVFGIDGWEREHQLIDGKLFCTVRVWSDRRGCWISKQDVGTESNAEKEKGQASDSFKRACVNLGIGRELYSSPFIWINFAKGYDKYSKFEVKEIGYNDDNEIDFLVIVDDKGKEAYRYGKNELLEKVYEIALRKGFSRLQVDRHIVSKGFDEVNFNNEAFKVMYEGYSKMEDK